MNEYLKPFACAPQKAPFYISLAGVTYPSSNYHITRTKADTFVIEYVTDGAGYVFANGKMNYVGKDTVYLLVSGEKHDYYADSENPFQKIFLNLSGEFCKQLVLAYGLSGKYFFDGNGLKPTFEKIVDIISSEMPDNDMQTVLQGIFVEIISKLSVAVSENRHSDEALKLKNYLDTMS